MNALQRLAGLAVLCGALFPAARGQDVLSHASGKFRTARDVYGDIVRAIGDGRPAPAFELRPNGTAGAEKVAWFDPAARRITLEERAFDICISLGPDSLNALAVLLGHELAHYYKDHAWSGDFGNAFADIDAGKTVGRTGVSADDVTALETQADEFGGFFGYLAGYRTLDVAPKLLSAVYTTYHLNAHLRGYPSLDDRTVIALRSEERLKSFVPLFEAAGYLLLLKEYDEAALLFDFIAGSFPGREILANAGVVRALAALDLFDRRQVRFAYPFELDANTRLRGDLMRGASDSSAAERRARLLEEAREKFEEAIKRDPDYAPAQVDLACVYELQGEGDLAAAHATKAIAVARKAGDESSVGRGFIARGIAHADAGRGAEAFVDFESAGKSSPSLASLNMKILRPGGNPETARDGTKQPGKSLKPETIGGLVPRQIGSAGVAGSSTCLPVMNCDAPEYAGGSVQPGVRVDVRRSERWEGVTIGFGKKRIVVVKTGIGYKGESNRGVGIGTRAGDVEVKYGTPSSTLSDSQGVFLVFRESGIIFHAGPDSTITSWMIFSGE